MKFLLAFLVVLVIAWRWRAWRESAQRGNRNAKVGDASAAEMIPCRQCGMHLPANEAIAGKLGHYCSQEHRLKVEP
jgi:uncharacterized protein